MFDQVQIPQVCYSSVNSVSGLIITRPIEKITIYVWLVFTKIGISTYLFSLSRTVLVIIKLRKY